MSKRRARRLIAEAKHGCTVKEFLTLCADMGHWFDDIQGTELAEAEAVLSRKEN